MGVKRGEHTRGPAGPPDPEHFQTAIREYLARRVEFDEVHSSLSGGLHE